MEHFFSLTCNETTKIISRTPGQESWNPRGSRTTLENYYKPMDSNLSLRSVRFLIYVITPQISWFLKYVRT
jgi:hypothetical protein